MDRFQNFIGLGKAAAMIVNAVENDDDAEWDAVSDYLNEAEIWIIYENED